MKTTAIHMKHVFGLTLITFAIYKNHKCLKSCEHMSRCFMKKTSLQTDSHACDILHYKSILMLHVSGKLEI
jgi:hypothetical protein